MNEGICMLVDYSATMYHVGITQIPIDMVNMDSVPNGPGRS